jgi:hypothetical protein
MPVSKLDISSIVDALDRPHRVKGRASFLFAQAPWLNVLRYSLIAAGGLAAVFPQYSKFTLPLILSGVALFFVQSVPGLRGFFAGSLSRRLSLLREQRNGSGLDNLDFAQTALATIAAMKARTRVAAAGTKPNFVQYVFERFLSVWPLLVFATLIWAWPLQLTFEDTMIAIGALAGLFVLGALYYLALIHQHPGTPTRDSRVLAISAYGSQHLRQAAYFTIAAALWYAIARLLPSIADESHRHALAVAFLSLRLRPHLSPPRSGTFPCSRRGTPSGLIGGRHSCSCVHSSMSSWLRRPPRCNRPISAAG